MTKETREINSKTHYKVNIVLIGGYKESNELGG